MLVIDEKSVIEALLFYYRHVSTARYQVSDRDRELNEHTADGLEAGLPFGELLTFLIDQRAD